MKNEKEILNSIDSQEIEMNQEEKQLKLRRLEKRKLRVINRLIAGEINGTQAAKKLKLTIDQRLWRPSKESKQQLLMIKTYAMK